MASSISVRRQRQILAVLLGAFAVLGMASIATFRLPPPGTSPWNVANACGPVGATLAFGLAWTFGGIAAFGVPLLALLWSIHLLRKAPGRGLAISSAVGALLVFELCTLAALAGLDRWVWAGAWGVATAMSLHAALGGVGSWVVGCAFFGITAIAASELGFHWIGRFLHAVFVVPVSRLVEAWQAWREGAARAQGKPRKPRDVAKEPSRARRAEPVAVASGARAAASTAPPRIASSGTPVAQEHETDDGQQFRLPLAGIGRRESANGRNKSRPAPAAPAGAAGVGSAPAGSVPSEPLPSLSLLSMPTQPEDLITAADLTSEANLLVAKLRDFGIEGRVTEIHPGPVVTTFEFEPAAGVKVNQIVSREDDLALTLRAQRIRILAPIPGKGTVGVEIPNRMRRTVYLREVLSSRAYDESGAVLKIPLGVDVVGQPFVADLTRMPHVLVAGATGSGKSVCLHSVITGLLFQHGPDTLQLVMIDPKMLELSVYNGIPHLVLPVITEPKKASRALRWAVAEMEKRYKLMAICGARNIQGYNDKVSQGLVSAAPGIAGAESLPPERLSFVVVVIDELADLMLTAPGEIEEPIARLAQMARAVGIHLLLATQRPSVDVITGVIKANFPSRIAFQVASKTDSRTVLDMNGAENLLGHGDMLFIPAGKPEPYRIHGCYVSEEETGRVVEFWKSKLKAVPLAEGHEAVRPPLATRPTINEADEEPDGSGENDDELLQEAAKLVVHHQQGSTSLLQRRLKVGYSRAGRLMDQLEQIGVVGPFQGSKARDVLVDERWVEDRFSS